ncbi:MAG: SDR family oxidoreductase [Microcella sp.]|uniref:SDR family NAD(P)-dependent oxidoreductase n=1 Tax=Microcella sp. TaxID=1913979 RepID=UPI0024C720FD|nr:SDR family oxidoreductase [Microcella sp.]UYN84472.1 MAG: SDR family oxidoreductase [Microcella sp.]
MSSSGQGAQSPTVNPGAIDLSSATALVTGSSRNLGLAIATRLAAAAARVVVHARTDAEAQNARREIIELVPEAELTTAVFDLADADQIDAAVDELAAAGWSPSILVNNAALLDVESAGFMAQPREAFREVLEVNLFGVHHLSKRAAAAMIDEGRGAIIMISSLAGERAIHGRPAYDVSKSALDGLTRAMAIELAPHGVRVNAIAPGYIHSDRWQHLTDEALERRRANVPWGLPTEAAEIAELVALLASDLVPSMIGSRIIIDGGLAAQQVPRSDVA